MDLFSSRNWLVAAVLLVPLSYVAVELFFLPAPDVGVANDNGLAASQYLQNPTLNYPNYTPKPTDTVIDRNVYHEKLMGFWLGQCIANWTGLVTEMDKIGGEGIHGVFYTRHDWGQPDQASIWGQGVPSDLSATIDWVYETPGSIWGADDDTDIEYMYQHLLLNDKTSVLTGEQIRAGWLRHIYTDETTPFINDEGKPENYLWVSNQRAHDLMLQGRVPPATSDPLHNPDTDMIDAQLTTEIFGLFAPARPKVALALAHLPIRTSARGEAALISEFYVMMYSLASLNDAAKSPQQQIEWMAVQARQHLPSGSYSAAMYDYVKAEYDKGRPWEAVRDGLYQRYQVDQADGYHITARGLYCNGCFAAGINFGASLISLFYGAGDFKETVKLAVLMGWDSDNPAATWGGLLGFIMGKKAIENTFEQHFSNRFNIHRTRANFPNNGVDTFEHMATQGLQVIDRVVIEQMHGGVNIEKGEWYIPQASQGTP